MYFAILIHIFYKVTQLSIGFSLNDASSHTVNPMFYDQISFLVHLWNAMYEENQQIYEALQQTDNPMRKVKDVSLTKMYLHIKGSSTSMAASMIGHHLVVSQYPAEVGQHFCSRVIVVFYLLYYLQALAIIREDSLKGKAASVLTLDACYADSKPSKELQPSQVVIWSLCLSFNILLTSFRLNGCNCVLTNPKKKAMAS